MPRQYRLSVPARHILANLAHVVAKPYKIEVAAPRRRSQLDGGACTAQITSLVVGGYVSEEEAGALTRTLQGDLMLKSLDLPRSDF